MDEHEEERLMQSVALQNATAVFLARQRAEEELLRTKAELEAKTQELMRSLSAMEASLSERDRARSDAEEAKRAAQAANEAKGRFLRMISHELRTPLGAIGGYAALMHEGIHGPLTEAQRESIQRIRYNQQHLLGLVDQLLDFARLEAGRYRLKSEAVAVDDVVASVLPMIEPQMAQGELKIDVVMEDHGCVAHADRERVQQIVLNLLSNSVKFTEPGGTVTIRASAREQLIDVEVEDTGIGIPPAQLEEVFESFMQVAPSLTPEGGTGLGLAISRQLALAMGGDLTARSRLGRGSTFTLTLPRSTAK
jgi:signal transduction histidine kinase